ncbi:hypothetical protein CEB3_c40140 [Peptococcaceae bacterium CEB3]|nr:hypothetical protein CEB3_c40140 [Peptococcaceae bacterium CEB3]
MQMARSTFFEPEDLWQEAETKITQLKKLEQRIDYITFVGDGEPTLDENLGKTIGLFRQSGFKVAVISNASLIWRHDVKDDLMLADWVSLKVDSVRADTWHNIDRPYGYLSLKNILNGIIDFARVFKGTLVTETMLVRGINDDEESVGQTAAYLRKVKPAKTYILVPTRPPAEKAVMRPKEENLRAACRIFGEKVKTQVECICGDEGTDFSMEGDPREDILSIASVHPLRKEVVALLLKRRNCEMDVVDKLLKEGAMEQVSYEGRRYLLRKW